MMVLAILSYNTLHRNALARQGKKKAEEKKDSYFVFIIYS